MQRIKKLYKFIMSILLKIYTLNFKLIIQSQASPNDNKHYSQFGQDLFVLNNFKVNNGGKKFIDIGGNHPINGSNTYLLELNNWTGIAIEPQEKLRKLWPSLRKTPCLNYVIGPEEKIVNFVEGENGTDGLSGIEGYNKCNNTNYKTITAQQKRLADILVENKIKNVDYLSIDVEGYEMNVLKSIDFSKVDIKLIGLENDLGFRWLPFLGHRLGKELGDNKIRKFLKDKGYKYIARIVCDDFFIKE
jgi:FkbM family methyltransferase